MRNALAHTRINPQDKINKIKNMCELLFQQKAIKNWGIEIDQVPITLQSCVLQAPQILQQNQLVHINDNVLRKLPIQKPVDLLEGEWIMIYQNPQDKSSRRRSYYNNADNVYNTFVKACSQLRIKVQEPFFIETENEADRYEVEGKILSYMMRSPDSVFRHPKMVVVILGNESQYKMYKELF